MARDAGPSIAAGTMNIWRDRLHRWLSPIARVIPLSPNGVTLLALLLNIAAAIALWRGLSDPRLFLAGIALLSVGGLADALDGITARVRNQATRYGDFLDHCADRLSDALLVAGWMAGSRVNGMLFTLALIAVSMNGYVGTQLEATWREREYTTIGRGEFVLALVVFPLVSYILATNQWDDAALASLRIADWLTCLIIVFASVGIVQRMRLAANLEQSE